MIKRALIIDDDEINNFICIRNIRETNFASDASFCLRGREGLDMLKEMAASQADDFPEVIFLDINMPLMNAWEFLEDYKQMRNTFPKDTHLFILSSSVYRKDIERSSHYDVVTDYIIKPLNRAKLSQIKEKYFS